MTATVPLKDLCDLITKGTTPTSIGFDFADNGIGFLRVQNISGGAVNFEGDTLFIDEQVHQSLRRSQIFPGDVLLSIAGSIGRTGVVPDHAPPLNCNQAVAILRSSEKVHRPFLRNWLECEDAQKQMRGATVTGTIQNLSLTQIGELKISLPPLPEQRRIAAILDQADALRAKRREALAQLDSLTQSIFIDMFGDPGNNPMGWPEKKLGELIVGKPNNGIFKKNEEYGEGMPVAWVEELFRGNAIDISESRRLQPTLKEVEQYGLRNGDVLFCRSSLKLAGIGYNNVYLGEDNKALFECHIIRVSPDKSKIASAFLNFALRMPNQRRKLFKFAKTVTMSTIDQDGLQQISLPVPPLETQELFSERLKAIDGVRRQHHATTKEFDTLFASLQHRAFRGEL